MTGLRIATRGSALALRQTELAIEALRAADPSLEPVVVPVTTRGDTDRVSPLRTIGGQGVFVRAVEEALQDDRADVAAHSLKDVPAELTPGLVLAAMLRRTDPRDVLVGGGGRRLSDLPAGARVGTSSRRRAMLLRLLRPDLQIDEIRGNIDTRMQRVRDGDYDAVVLAAAGLVRLDRMGEATQLFEAAEFLPSPGQGVIALQCRADDAATVARLRAIDHPETRAAAAAERAYLRALGAGCSLPVGAYAEVQGEHLALRVMLGDEAAGITAIPRFADAAGSIAEAEQIGRDLGELMLRPPESPPGEGPFTSGAEA